MDASPHSNPDFHDWAKLFVPYCSADLHAGTRTDRSAALGGWYFSGHNLLAGALSQLRRIDTDWKDLRRNHSASPPQLPQPSRPSQSLRTPARSPLPPLSHVLVTGSSAGGIGALLHADWLASHWPNASVKVSPEAGLFYPPVASVRDTRLGRQTDPSAMGMHAEWRPFLHAGCAAAQGGSAAAVVARCTNAHELLRHVHTPLYVRENVFDSAKLANCGLDVHAPRTPAAVAYLRVWGRQTRAALEAMRATHPRSGYFAPSCIAQTAKQPRTNTHPASLWQWPARWAIGCPDPPMGLAHMGKDIVKAMDETHYKWKHKLQRRVLNI